MSAREGSGDFGGELTRYRESAGLSHEELAERAGITAKTISALEPGERQHPYPQTVRALADALNLPHGIARLRHVRARRRQVWAVSAPERFGLDLDGVEWWLSRLNG